MIDSGELMLHHFSSSDFFIFSRLGSQAQFSREYNLRPFLWIYYAKTFLFQFDIFTLFGVQAQLELFFIFDRKEISDIFALIS